MQHILSHATKFELHYYFADQTHSMSALTRNKCEYELLQIINEVAFQLGIKVEIDAEALQEGGLREVWDFIGDNSSQLTVIILLLTFIVTCIPEGIKKLEELQIKETELSIEEKKLNIEKLKNDLRKNESIEHIDLDALISDFNTHLKIIKHKSNFYSQLSENKKVIKITTNALSIEKTPIDKEKTVERKDFHKFILTTDNLPPEIDERAEIEIVAPVLKQGNYKWKGIYQDEVITFYMKDSEFKHSVIAGEIPFKSGTFLECVLEKSRKVDNFGEIIITGYSVNTVVRKIDDSEVSETAQGKRYWKNKELKSRQRSLFDSDK